MSCRVVVVGKAEADRAKVAAALFGEGVEKIAVEYEDGRDLELNLSQPQDAAGSESPAGADSVYVQAVSVSEESVAGADIANATAPVFVFPVKADDQQWKDVPEAAMAGLDEIAKNGGSVLQYEGEDASRQNHNALAAAYVRVLEAREAATAAERAVGDNASADEAQRAANEVPKNPALLPPNQYLEESVMPVLTEGLARLAAVRPSNPVQWLAVYLLQNDPKTAPILEPEDAGK